MRAARSGGAGVDARSDRPVDEIRGADLPGLAIRDWPDLARRLLTAWLPSRRTGPDTHLAIARDVPAEGIPQPELAYAVEQTDEHGENLSQLAAFFTLQAAEECLSRRESEGFSNLHINLIQVHTRLDDWELDR